MVGPLAFGFGGRVCPGRRIALAEMKAFLAALLCVRRVALRNPGEPLSLDMDIGLRIAAGNGNIRFEPLP
jgi:cytochrome P450